MSEGVVLVLFFLAVGVIYLIVSYVGNKIVDKGSDTISNAYKRKKNFESEEKTENLSDRYRR